MFRLGLRILILFPILFFVFGCSKKKLKEPEQKTVSSGNFRKALGDFYFVGMIGDNPGIYKFHSRDKSVSSFWSKDKEKVIELSYSADRKHAFFLTAADYGKNGIFPFVKDVRLYLLNIDSSKIIPVYKIGNGIQIFTAWETDNTFKIVLNEFDKTIANYIDQKILIFSQFGKKLVDNTKTYDITKQGYPKPPSAVRKFISADGKKLLAKKDSSEFWIFLSSGTPKTQKLITRTDQNLNDALWSSDGKILIFSTLDISQENKSLYSTQPSTSKLYVYSLLKRRIIKAWNGAGIKNFFIKGGFLIFDDGFDGSSSIHIFNYRINEPVFTIKIKGGCGLRNIPSVPKYGG